MLDRTFIVLPERRSGLGFPSEGDAVDHFFKTPNNFVDNEIKAHTGMFEAKTNDGYHELVLETSWAIREAIMSAQGVVEGK